MNYDQAYLDFYEVYPRKEGKADGQKAWSAMSESDQKLAKADVEKRKRMGAYSSNKKMIQLPASYLRARRFEDDWMATLESSRHGDDLPNTGMPVPKVGIETPNLPWRERLVNRCFKSWMLCTIRHGGVPEVATALQIKRDVLQEAQLLEGAEYAEQAETIADLFTDRLDKAYGYGLARQALKNARRAKREQ